MTQRSKRPRLGKGLASLIRNSAEEQIEYQPFTKSTLTKEAITFIPIEEIAPNPSQPRRNFDENSLAQLADSIRTFGILQPVLVKRIENPQDNKKYQLIAGERRLRAAMMAKLEQIPCIIKPASRLETLELSLIENLQRADLNPIEKAMAYQKLIDQFQLTQQQVADRVGLPRTTIANYLRLLDLCDEVQSLIIDGSLSFGHGKVLASLAGKTDIQKQLAKKVVKEGISVRQLEKLIEIVQGQKQPVPQKAASAPTRSRSAYIINLEKQLTESIGTKVSIKPGRAKNTGKIIIEYYDLDDFDRILSALGVQLES